MRRNRVVSENAVICPFCAYEHVRELDSVRAGQHRRCDGCSREFVITATWRLIGFQTATPSAVMPVELGAVG